MMRGYLRLLPACLYARLVRRHGELVAVKGMVYAWDGGDILVRMRDADRSSGAVRAVSTVTPGLVEGIGAAGLGFA